MSSALPDPVPIEGPRQFLTTSTDLSGVTITVASMLMTWMVLFSIIRIYIRADINGPFGMDDLMVGLGTVVGVAEMIAICISISNGFGKSLSLLDAGQVLGTKKALYVADLLYIIANCLAKCSVAFLIARLDRMEYHLIACKAIIGICATWGIVSTLALALRCDLRQPWFIVNERCTNLFLRWELITVFDILIEVMLLAMAAWLVWSLQMRLKSKLVVVGAFSFRFPVIVIAILRIFYVRNMVNSTDPFLVGVAANICMQLEMNYSLMSATVPCLKPFIISCNTSWGTTVPEGTNYAMQSMSNMSGSRNIQDFKPHQQQNLRPDDCNHSAYIAHEEKKVERGDSDSVESQGSQQMIIRRTTAWSVNYDNGGDHPPPPVVGPAS